MPPPFHLMRPSLDLLGIEILYFAILVTLCLIIYFKTKDIYDLTRHKGIFYFRNIFFYFSLAYFFRLVLVLVLASRQIFSIALPMIIHPISLFLFGYFSTMALLSLFMTLIIRYFKKGSDYFPYLLHGIAFVSSLAVSATRSHELMVLVQTAVFLLFVIIFFSKADKMHSKSFLSQNLVTYFLLLIFWIINALILSSRFQPAYFRTVFYILSLAVFFSVFLMVRKRLISNAKKKR